MKRMLCILLSAAMLMGLAGCGSEKGTEPLSRRTEIVYKAFPAEISKDIKGDTDYTQFSFSDGRIYFMSEYTPDESESYMEFYLNSADTEGKNFSSVCFEKGDNITLTPVIFKKDGLGYYAKTVYITEENEETKRMTELKTIDRDGREVSCTDISDIINEKCPDLYAYRTAVTDEYIFIADMENMAVFDHNGGFVTLMEGLTYLHGGYEGKDGKIYLNIWTGSRYELRGAALPTGELEKPADTPFGYYTDMYADGEDSGYDLLVSDGTALYGYDVGGEAAEILNWTKAGVSDLEVSQILWAGDDTFITAGFSHPLGYPKISVVKKVETEVSDRQEIILGCTEFGIDGLIENKVIEFNNSSRNYHITVKKYASEKSSDLDLDIISGRTPDIIMTDPYTPIDNYIAKGVFADLYPFIDTDKELSRGDFNENFLRVCETDGKLCRLSDRFKIYTVLGKASVFGNDMGITLDRLKAIAAAQPAGTEIMPATTKTDFLRYALQISGDRYFDLKNGSCDFEGKEFTDIVKYAGTFLESIDMESYFNDEFWKSLETMYSDGSALLMLTNLENYDDIYRFEHAEFGERVTAVGFPCEEGIGTAFVLDYNFAISEKSAVKDGAWEFVRTLLLPSYQDGVEQFPVRKDSLAKKANHAKKLDRKRVNNATIIMGQCMLSSGAYMKDLGAPEQADIDKVNEVIASAARLMSFDSNVEDIVMEEAGTCFGGSKSAEEVCGLMQNRVRIYLSEKS